MSDHHHKKQHPPRHHENQATGRETAVEPSGLTPQRMVLVVVMTAAVFLGAYNFASARGSASAGSALAGLGAQGGGGCCGGGGAPVEAAATVEGGVQKIAVDTSTGSFNPNVLRVKAGVPLEIAFSQSAGGCLSGVLFPDFNISEDLTAGGKTVKLPALEKGTYTFFCQMQMVSAQIIAE